MKDYFNAPVRSNGCLMYDIVQLFAGKCLPMAFPKKENIYVMRWGTYVWGLCACVCVYMLVKVTVSLEKQYYFGYSFLYINL